MLIMRMAVGHVIHLHKDPRIQQKKTMKYAHSDEDHLIIANRRVPARGGGGTASLKVTTHCQTTAPVI